MHILGKNTPVYFCISTFKYPKKISETTIFHHWQLKEFTWLDKIDRNIKWGKIVSLSE